MYGAQFLTWGSLPRAIDAWNRSLEQSRERTATTGGNRVQWTRSKCDRALKCKLPLLILQRIDRWIIASWNTSYLEFQSGQYIIIRTFFYTFLCIFIRLHIAFSYSWYLRSNVQKRNVKLAIEILERLAKTFKSLRTKLFAKQQNSQCDK